jgi:hypothetical protein
MPNLIIYSRLLALSLNGLLDVILSVIATGALINIE